MEATVLKPGEWMCVSCGQSIETQYLVCWSCGDPREGTRVVENPLPLATTSGCGCGPGGCGGGSTRGGLMSIEFPPEFEERIRENDRLAQHALWSAAASLLLPPVLIYAVTMVIRSALVPLSGHGSQRFYKALVLTLASSSLWYWVLKTKVL